jgi:NADH:ubiquinone oxidoreductase subunit F (NADH-binding)/(2Fe-2S) ferredoxin
MSRLKSVSELEDWREAIVRTRSTVSRRIMVCDGRSCSTLASNSLQAAFVREIQHSNLAAQVAVVATGCQGFCELGPLVEILPDGILYTRVLPEDTAEIVAKTIARNEVIERLVYHDPQTGRPIPRKAEVPFYGEQTRILLKDLGLVDPSRIEDYVAIGGYKALAKALGSMSPEAVVAEIKRSGLRGRGGAGFPTGVKWELCRRAPGDARYIICNADEANPGAFQDRALIGGNPHSILEGMIIGAYAIGATCGYIYLRHDHQPTIEVVRQAIQQCRDRGLLGENILGFPFTFDLRIQLGAGAFVCGEETALIASIEDRVSEPVFRPPFPSERGLWGKPTNINNAKTWATVPCVVGGGAEAYRQWGTEKSKGTTVFSLNGKITYPGLVEVPMGVTLRHIIYNIGGGIKDGRKFKAVQPGGPSGGCIPESLLDLPVDYESLAEAGSMMGSGGLIVMDEDTCMVDVARYFTAFNQAESCGKCSACREGVRQMHRILTRMVEGSAKQGDIELLQELAEAVRDGAFCGLGKAAPNPVLTTLRYFRNEYEAHVRDRRCPAGVCAALAGASSVHASAGD